METTMLRSLLTTIVLFIAVTDAAWAQSKIAYQGRLEDAATGPLSGSYDFAFTIYNHPTLSDSILNYLWSEEQAGVAVVGGAFTVKLGANVAIPNSLWNNPANPDLYLSIAVRPHGSSPWVPLNNRQQILHVPRSVSAETTRPCRQVTSAPYNMPAGAFTAPMATCATGERLTAGGYQTGTPQNVFFSSYPDIDYNRWIVSGYNARGDSPSVTVYAVCCP
jgi:hypothetical protein